MSVAPLHFLLLMFTGWLNQRQAEILEYLRRLRVSAVRTLARRRCSNPPWR